MNLSIKFDTNNLIFIRVSNYQFQPISFEYLLDGYLNNWTIVDETSVITFNNLKPVITNLKLEKSW